MRPAPEPRVADPISRCISRRAQVEASVKLATRP